MNRRKNRAQSYAVRGFLYPGHVFGGYVISSWEFRASPGDSRRRGLASQLNFFRRISSRYSSAFERKAPFSVAMQRFQ